MSESDRLLMKSKSSPRTDLPSSAHLIQSHWFNTEAIMAHNFGQGDDHCAIDPMDDPRVLGSYCAVAAQPAASAK
jgi:hypothetical protein